MGLDIYLTGEIHFFGRPRRRGDKKGELFDLGYWRERHDLHFFVVENFTNGDDSGRAIDLDAGDVARIIEAIKAYDLPHTCGDSAAFDPLERSADLEIFRAAFAWVNDEGDGECRSISYRASW